MPRSTPDPGWTFGTSVELGKTGVGSAVGRYGWTGGSGCAVYADSAQDSVDILLTRRVMEGPFLHPHMHDLATATYAAFAD
ncbi:MAG: hypothetical protein J2P44_10790 [Candidatus Dormibacteraeota bacterium]|nr:hypothetical protein [Candidatus Dormibacteraeota bacterium]